jgi:hypothetical protein
MPCKVKRMLIPTRYVVATNHGSNTGLARQHPTTCAQVPVSKVPEVPEPVEGRSLSLSKGVEGAGEAGFLLARTLQSFAPPMFAVQTIQFYRRGAKAQRNAKEMLLRGGYVFEGTAEQNPCILRGFRVFVSPMFLVKFPGHLDWRYFFYR